MPQTQPGTSTPSEQSQWEAIVARMPRPNPEDKTLKNIKEGEVERLVEELWRAGSAAVAALLRMLRDPADVTSDSPARHLLHALVTSACGRDEQHRHSLSMTLLAALDNPNLPLHTRTFIVRQLQLCGGAETVGVLRDLLRDDDLYADAGMALRAIGPRAAVAFRTALPDVTGPQRVAVIQALGTLKDRESAEPLRRAAIDDADPVARLEAVWALASIGDAGSADLVLAAADGAAGFDRTRATDACLLLAENLAAAGRTEGARKIYQHLRDTRAGPEAYVRTLAENALKALG